MTVPPEPTPAPRQRSPLSWVILVVAMTIGAYVLVTAFEGYDADAPICVKTALTTGVESIPKSCKFPALDLALGALIIGAGMTLANKVNGASRSG